jgi:hypothetical protein
MQVTYNRENTHFAPFFNGVAKQAARWQGASQIYEADFTKVVTVFCQ